MADEHRVSLRLAWIGIDDTPVQFVNQVIAQHMQHEFFLTLGQMTPPILLGDEDEQRQQAQMLPFIQVTPVARLAFTPAGMRDLVRVLVENVRVYDEKEWEEGDA